MRRLLGNTDHVEWIRVRALRLALAAGALAVFAPALARDNGPYSTFPPPSPRNTEPLRIRTLPDATGDDVRVSGSPGEALAEVIIDVNPLNPSNLVICGYSRSLRTMSTFHSFDAGRTWTYVPVGDANDGLGDVDRFDPTLVFDRNGAVYAGYGARVPDGLGFRDHLIVCRSDDGGASWGDGVGVWVASDVSGAPGNDKFHLAAGPDRFDPDAEVIVLAWTWNISPPFGVIDQQIVFSRSVDAGVTFSEPVVINDDSISDRDFAIFADPGIGPEGIMYVCWNDLNTNEIRVDHSFDNGRTWGIDVIVERETIPFRTRIIPQPNRGVFAGPVLDVDRSGGVHNGRVYIAYCHGTIDDTDVLVRYSDDSANTFSSAVRVNDDGPGSHQFLPWIDVNQTDGQVNVVFYDTREDTLNELSRVHLAASRDGAASFFRSVPVADVPSNNSRSNPNRYPGNFLEYIGVTAWGCDALVAWTDTRNAPSPLTDYYFDRVPADSTAPEIVVTVDRGVLWPPNRAMVEVNTAVAVSDDQDPASFFVLESVVSSEPPGGGRASEDIRGAAVGTPDTAFELRAERAGRGDGRTYSIVYRAADRCGNTARDTVRVHVPHDMGRALPPSEPGTRAADPARTGIAAIEPNPANPAITVRFLVAEEARVRISVLDVRGREVAAILDEPRPSGSHAVRWDGTNAAGSPVASGVYFVRLEAGATESVRKVVVIR